MCEYKSVKLVCVVKAITMNLCNGDLTLVFEFEHNLLDPKGGDLYLSWVKPEETLVEARSDTDVQIVRRTWA